MPTDIKLSKNKISKTIQSGGYFGSWSGNLGKKALTNITIHLARDNLPAIPHINSDINPPPPLSMLFASIWDSFLAQASVLLLFQYAATLSRGEGPGLFL